MAASTFTILYDFHHFILAAPPPDVHPLIVPRAVIQMIARYSKWVGLIRIIHLNFDGTNSRGQWDTEHPFYLDEFSISSKPRRGEEGAWVGVYA